MSRYCNMLKANCLHEIVVKNQCFIMMSYKRSDRLEQTLTDVIKNTYGLRPVIAKEVKIEESSFMFCEKICRQIRSSLICFADVSRDNTNVGFELGIAWECKKPFFYSMNKRIRHSPPSDLAGLYGLWYDNYGQLRNKMIKEIHVGGIRKIKKEKTQEKKKELLLEMMEEYATRSPPAV